MIASALIAGGSLALSAYQQYQAQKMEAQAGDRPTYGNPESEARALHLAQMNSLQSKYPGQDLYETQIAQNQANQLSNIKDTASSGVGALEAARRSSLDNNNLLAQSNIRGAEYQSNMRDKYIQALMTDAGYQDKSWQLNNYDPYNQESAAAGKLQGASLTNAMQGISAYGNYLDTKNLDPSKGYLNNSYYQQQMISNSGYGRNNQQLIDSFM